MIHKHTNIGRFAGIPNSVVESNPFKSLNGNSVKLLIILAYQYNSHNNGDLVITPSILSRWLNKNTMDKAKKELYEKGFIVINAYGGLGPNRIKLPGLYAITWTPINKLTKPNNKDRVVHYPINGLALNYWKQGKNPDIKTNEEKKKQFVTDYSALN
jgi:hypothetical protein